MANQPPVFLIIPIHNGLENTIECLENIRILDYSNFKTIIVDDGSTDGSQKYISEHFPDVVILKGDGNLWWSGAVNRGVEYALKNQVEYICLLNNDNTFKRNFLSVLIESAENQNVHAVCSKVYYKNTDIVFQAGTSRSKWGEIIIFDGKDREEFNIEKPVEWLSGTGVVIQAGIFRDIGLFDERQFPHYLGDADFGLRMTKNGYKILYQPKSIIYNDYESTGISIYSGKISDIFKAFFSLRSINNIRICYRFYRRHSPRYALLIVMRTILRAFYSYIRAVITRKSKIDLKKNR
jgi:GT2 family glycosyltransferase